MKKFQLFWKLLGFYKTSNTYCRFLASLTKIMICPIKSLLPFVIFCPWRKLGTAGQKLGGSAALCHIRHDPTDPSGCFTLTAANVGKCQAILCRDGKPLSLSLLHNVELEEEYRRIRQHRAIITEVETHTNMPSTMKLVVYFNVHYMIIVVYTLFRRTTRWMALPILHELWVTPSYTHPSSLVPMCRQSPLPPRMSSSFWVAGACGMLCLPPRQLKQFETFPMA